MKNLIAVLFAVVLAAVAQANPVTITRAKASELFMALRALDGGLSPENTGIAADDINALEPKVDGRDKAIASAQRKSAAIDRTDPAYAAKQQAIQDNFDAFSEGTIIVQLDPLKLTANEIRDAHVTPKALSLIRKYLRDPKP